MNSLTFSLIYVHFHRLWWRAIFSFVIGSLISNFLSYETVLDHLRHVLLLTIDVHLRLLEKFKLYLWNLVYILWVVIWRTVPSLKIRLRLVMILLLWILILLLNLHIFVMLFIWVNDLMSSQGRVIMKISVTLILSRYRTLGTWLFENLLIYVHSCVVELGVIWAFPMKQIKTRRILLLI